MKETSDQLKNFCASSLDLFKRRNLSIGVLYLTLADVMAVRRVGFVLRRHHDVPGGHPGLRLQTEALHAAADTNREGRFNAELLCK